jgi:predicted DNA-binding WGR domain protein
MVIEESNKVTLYSSTKNKDIQVWSIELIDSNTNVPKIVMTYGKLNGKQITTTKEYTKGKAHTTAYEQALKEFNSMITKKKKKDYTEDVNLTNKSTILYPMLAQNFDKYYKYISYPCFIQPKLDGVRAIYHSKKLWSRLNNEFVHLDYILKELNELTGINLDGELYSETLYFEELTGLVKKKTLEEGDTERLKQIKYVVYDYIDTTRDFIDRFSILTGLFSKVKFKYIELLKTDVCNNKEEVYMYHKKYVKDNYEGAIVRNMNGKYLIKYRSKDLQKYKTMIDKEFKIIDYKSGTSTHKDAIIFIIEISSKLTTDVVPSFSIPIRKEMYKHGKDYIGKMLTVKFQEYTEDGNLRFPIGVSIRDYE